MTSAMVKWSLFSSWTVSASVGINNFFNELKFVKKLLADFTVAPDATRVAIITFSSKHRVELNVNQLEDGPRGNRHHKCALLNEDLPRITYVGGGTYTKGAFEMAKVFITLVPRTSYPPRTQHAPLKPACRCFILHVFQTNIHILMRRSYLNLNLSPESHKQFSRKAL